MRFDLGLPQTAEIIQNTFDVAKRVVHGVLFDLSLPPYENPEMCLRQYIDSSTQYQNPALPIYEENPTVNISSTIAHVSLGSKEWILTLDQTTINVHAVNH